MAETWSELVHYLQYPFVQYALAVGLLIALCSSVLGVTLVLKRFSYIGDGLSHVAFGALAVSAVLGITDNTVFILAVTIICAVLLLKSGQNTHIQGDAMLAMLSVSALAIGYLFMNIFHVSSNIAGDVCTTLFGSTSILTLTSADVQLCIILALVVMLVYIVFYNQIFAITFDEDFAKASGVHTERYNTLLAVLIGVIIVLAMKLVGSLLISALVIFPALSAMRVCRDYKSVTIFAAVFSLICTLIGMLISILAATPVGSTIVAVDIIGFLFFYFLGKMQTAD